MATESASAQNNARFHYHHLESFFTSASQTQAVAINNDHVIVGFTVEGGFTLHRAFA